LIFMIGILTSFAVGFLVIKFLLRFLETHSLKIFAWYRLGLAALIAIILYSL
jgi:undecaprenyl-diphosphatase